MNDRPAKRPPAALSGLLHVQAEVLNVAPQLVGAPLATPPRRAAALALDGLVVALLTGTGGLWLVLGLVIVVAQLRPRAEAPVRGGAARRRAPWGWIVAAVLLFLAGSEAQDRWEAWQHPERAAAASASAVASSATGPGVLASAPALDPQARRIAELEAELQQVRRQQPLSWRAQWREIWDEVASGLGWGIVYFSLLPAWWGGQTVGKKVFGLRVVELTGQPMTVMRCLKRYGGYAAGLSTGGLGFAQALWDPNRQALQDKAAHTVVLDLRAVGPPAPT